jgi:nitroreductase/Pyruvate/2-oxoacid:ferredoxin oxidoreductase delta subunit
MDFVVDKEKCISCGQCVADCAPRIIFMRDGFPAIRANSELPCLKCQHCLAICPKGAVSIMGRDAAQSIPLAGNQLDSRLLEILIKGRRSVRRYKDENLPPELIQRLLDVASHAPSASNARQVRYTLVDNKEKMAELRNEAMSGFRRLAEASAFPPGLEYFGWYAEVWDKMGKDVLFRNAPHLLVTSAPRSCQGPTQDSVIALAYFELFAQSLGIGALWDGVVTLAIDKLLPKLRKRLEIPDDHMIGESMIFGRPAMRYARTVQYAPHTIHRVQ